MKQDTNDYPLGLFSVLLAYTLWALVPIYWKLLEGIPAVELMVHRVVWAFLLLLPFVVYGRRKQDFLHALRSRRSIAVQNAAAWLLAVNWLTYVWAVTHERIVEASLGYFLSPLVSTAFAFCFLRERLAPVQWLAVALAAIGVLGKIAMQGHVPVVSLLIAFSWSGYSLMKKRATTGAVSGLALETLMLLPFALIYLTWLQWSGASHFLSHRLSLDALLLAAGVVTTVPLLLFASGARKVPLATVGLLQYTVPSGTLALAVFLYNEPFELKEFYAFGCIWAGLFIYLYNSYAKR